jgi:hypothetical protein
MRKLIVLIVGLVIVIVLTLLAFDLKKSEKQTGDLSLIDFAIQDTSAVDKIVIYDSFIDYEFTLVRQKNGTWTDKDGGCVKPEMVKTMLETFLKVTLKGYVAQSAMENMKKMMMAKYKKVDIYINGNWEKSWYVGHSTSDHYGTHMLLETPDKKSDNPVIMGMKGFYGILGPRFKADPREYRCTELFSYKRDEIKSVRVKNNVHPLESFEVFQSKEGLSASSNGKEITNLSKNDLLFYLNGFENIHFNQPNFTLSKEDIDSIKQAQPDYSLSVEADSESYDIHFYRRPDPEVNRKDTLIYDKDYVWALKPNDEIVRMQFFVIGPLIFGKDIFVTNYQNSALMEESEKK